MKHACHACSKSDTAVEPFQSCGRCRCVYYCSHECQSKDWPNHKAACKKLMKATESNGQGKSPARSTQILSNSFFQDNFQRLTMEAGARGIPLDKVVYYVNFQSMHKDQPATQMFHESEAAKKLGGHYWWSQGGDSVLETYCAKRSECRQAGDRRVQLVHICLFDDSNLFGGRWIMEEEHSAKLHSWLSSPNGEDLQERLMVRNARQGMEKLVGEMETKRMMGPVTIHGLMNRPELNGTAAVAEGFDEEKARYLVRLADGSTLMLKAERLRAADGKMGKALKRGGRMSMYDDLPSVFDRERPAGSVSGEDSKDGDLERLCGTSDIWDQD